MINVLTIDLEDWYHVCSPGAHLPVVPPSRRRVVRNAERLLSLLAEYHVKATFFVLGSVAEDEPSLVPRIAAAGHEIASHGYSHSLVSLLSPETFRDEVRHTGSILERQCGVRPVGFRAPQWSISTASSWALEILREEGYRYDSSCNPLPFVGDARGDRHPFMVRTPAGPILEVPPMVTPSIIGNLPTGGGWGFRFFPRALIGRTVARLNGAGFPAVLYVHPRELDAGGPRVRLPLLRSFAAYGPRTDAGQRLRFLLQRYRFGTLRQMVEQWQPV